MNDASTINGELELCTDLHKAIAESMRKNKVTTESVTDKALRRRKVVPFYHELDDSLCSSLTEYTQNTEGSQCFEVPSDMDESLDSGEIPASRASKRRRAESDEENDNESNSTTKRRATISNDVPDINDDDDDNDNDNDENDNDENENEENENEEIENGENENEENDENSNSFSNINIEHLEEIFAEEEEYRYECEFY